MSGCALGDVFKRLSVALKTRMRELSPNVKVAFGLKTLVSRFTLAVAAIVLLPTVVAPRFGTGQPPNANAQTVVS